jgi:hypothetical protein
MPTLIVGSRLGQSGKVDGRNASGHDAASVNKIRLALRKI